MPATMHFNIHNIIRLVVLIQVPHHSEVAAEVTEVLEVSLKAVDEDLLIFVSLASIALWLHG